MGFRFRKQIGLKGLKLNIGKNGINSTSIKLARGITFNTKRGLTVGIPGTGMSYNFGKHEQNASVRSDGTPVANHVKATNNLPTERQIAYARDLGIAIPENISREDLSHMISKVVDKDSDPNPGLVEYAQGKGILVSPHMGKRSLYSLIFSSLSGEDKIAFFAFSIYRWLSDDRRANLDNHPNKDAFYEFAKSVADNESFQKSMNRYSGDSLRFFGTLNVQGKDATLEHTGGSTGTIAYKTAAEFLKNKFNLPLFKTKTITANDTSQSLNEAIGIDSSKLLMRERINQTKDFISVTGGYNLKLLIPILICIILLFTPLMPLGALALGPLVLWFLIDYIYKTIRYKMYLKSHWAG